MVKKWYALRSKSRKEEIVWRQLQAKGFETFFPRLRINPVNPRSKRYKPYFPGYLFVHVDLDDAGISAFQWIPHTLGLVTFGGEPADVPEHLIHAISRKLHEIAEAGGEKLNGLRKGDEIRIQEGPFSGYEAIFDERIAGSERVKVLLKLLDNQRQIPLELRASQIKKRQSKR